MSKQLALCYNMFTFNQIYETYINELMSFEKYRIVVDICKHKKEIADQSTIPD